MFSKKKSKTEKLSIQEYLKLKEQRAKNRFHFEPYPWPVCVAISIPLIMMAGLILGYIFYIRNISQ